MNSRPLDIRIYGESHAERIGVVARGLPKGAEIDLEELKAFLSRRAPGRSDWSTPRRESDLPEFLSGIEIEQDAGRARLTGETLEAVIYNTNIRQQDYDNVAKVPRPGHADYGAWVKYGRIPTGGGKWSGRMTAPLCIVGGICKQLLAAEGIAIRAHIKRIANVCDEPLTESFVKCGTTMKATGAVANGVSAAEDAAIFSDIPTVSPEVGERMKEIIGEARERGDSVGGEIGCMITGVRAGVGDALFDGIEAEIARLAFAIPAVKGIEFGSTKDYGSENNDPFIVEQCEACEDYEEPLVVRTKTNNCGGILGGISTGMPIEFTLKVKPTPSIAVEQVSVNLETMKPATIRVAGRHDPCILPRAVPVAEAAAAIAIYNLLNGE